MSPRSNVDYCITALGGVMVDSVTATGFVPALRAGGSAADFTLRHIDYIIHRFGTIYVTRGLFYGTDVMMEEGRVTLWRSACF